MQIARLAWGALLVAAPGLVVRVLGREQDDHVSRTSARILGARHVLQGAFLLVRTTPTALRVGALVDTLHAATAFGLAAADRAHTRSGLVDGGVATTFAVAGLIGAIVAAETSEAA